jgi:hypothetical protein
VEGVVRPLLAALLALGCAGPPCGVRICDIRDPDCQRAVGQTAACLRGVEPVEVPMTIVAAQAYIDEQVASATRDTDATEFGRRVSGLSLLDLAPSGLSVMDGARTQAWAGAFYDFETRGITVIDWGVPMNSRAQVALLAHEYTHALQDFHDAVFARTIDSTDQALGFDAAIEGEATLVQDLTELAVFAQDPNDVEWPTVFAGWQSSARGRLVLSGAPLFVADLYFVYPVGAELVEQAWSSGGWPAVEGLRTSPPVSSRQAASGFGAAEPAGGPWTEPLEGDALPALPDSYQLVTSDRLGAWLLEIYLDRLEVRTSSVYSGIRYHPGTNHELASRLRADQLAIQHDPTSAATVTSWRMRFDSPDSAAHVLAAMTPRVPAPTRVWQSDRDLLLVTSNGAPDAVREPTFPWKPLPPPMTSPAPLGRTARGRFTCPRRPPL